ncbi:hypothetical protein O3M35_008545 [Rhynocoris fuscipes]|uniref:Transglutaminase-like domain-containing protein n=1 Tax=Rhynocoris fuscipes TaxID=488301 RepID=A0AAW1DA58_9HEMI
MALKISSVNLMALENSKAHRTIKYEAVHLNPPTPIFRRGQEFEFEVSFKNRPYNPQADKLRVLFYYEDDKRTTKIPRGGSWITDSPDIHEDMEMWSLRMVSSQGKTIKLKMRTPTNTPIGCWKITIKTDLRSHLSSETYEHPETIYLLLNPWNKDDDSFMPETQLLEEYVLNDVGKVYTGAKDSIIGRHWLFGQFEAHVLPILRQILKESNLDYNEKGNPLNLCQTTFQTHSIIKGNWTFNFEDGTRPDLWTGSAPILKEYSETGEIVKYGQCWVLASVACSLCRAMGLPARVVTNIFSAKDMDESLTVDKYFDKDFNFLESESESMWNFHVWTDVWMARPDLPSGFGGWQAIDITSLKGPAPLEAIKRGEVGLEHDVPYMIAAVNADVIDWLEDDKELLGFKKIRTTTDHVGYKMLTKKPHIFDPNGDRDQDDIMNQYKNPEGSKEERLTLYKAAYKCSGRSCEVFEMEKAKEVEEIKFNMNDIESVEIGKNFSIVLDMENTVDQIRNVEIAVSVLSVHYNGVKGHTVKKTCDTVEIAPKAKKQITIEVKADDYIGKLVEFGFLKTYLIATVQETKQLWSGDDDFQIKRPSLTVEIGGPLKVGKPGKISFKLKNPLKRPLTECQLAFDCPGLLKYQKLPFRNVSPEENMVIEANQTPLAPGKLNLVALFHCKELQDIMGSALLEVS